MPDIHTFTLPSGETVTIDAIDRELVEAHGPWWALHKQHTTYAYANIHVDGKRTTLKLHRLILDVADGFETDHIDRDGLNNRRSNLRACTSSQNGTNKPPRRGSTSRFKGVGWHKRDRRWQARGTDADGQHHLGYFDDEVDAATAYDAFTHEHWGAFAWLNRDHFPEVADAARAVAR